MSQVSHTYFKQFFTKQISTKILSFNFLCSTCTEVVEKGVTGGLDGDDIWGDDHEDVSSLSQDISETETHIGSP